MSRPQIFIDGQEGTTGLQIRERLASRGDIEVLEIAADKRKDDGERSRLMGDADVVILCLPDQAACDALALSKNPKTKIIDASTAHRTNPAWAYGFPELSAHHRERIAKSPRVSNPGCHATGAAAIVYPLVAQGIIGADFPVQLFSITGFSGGGKKMIADFAEHEADPVYAGPRPYALGMTHKHVPEIKAVCGLSHAPAFTPILGKYYQGMIVSSQFHLRTLAKKLTLADLHDVYAAHFAGARFIKVMPPGNDADGGLLNPQALNGTNDLEIFIFGNDDIAMVCARFDNLGKGASGAAVQNMNIMLGVDEGL